MGTRFSLFLLKFLKTLLVSFRISASSDSSFIAFLSETAGIFMLSCIPGQSPNEFGSFLRFTFAVVGLVYILRFDYLLCHFSTFPGQKHLYHTKPINSQPDTPSYALILQQNGDSFALQMRLEHISLKLSLCNVPYFQ